MIITDFVGARTMKALDAAVFVLGEWSKSLEKFNFDRSQKCLDQHSDLLGFWEY